MANYHREHHAEPFAREEPRGLARAAALKTAVSGRFDQCRRETERRGGALLVYPLEGPTLFGSSLAAKTSARAVRRAILRNAPTGARQGRHRSRATHTARRPGEVRDERHRRPHPRLGGGPILVTCRKGHRPHEPPSERLFNGPASTTKPRGARAGHGATSLRLRRADALGRQRSAARSSSAIPSGRPLPVEAVRHNPPDRSSEWVVPSARLTEAI